MATASPERIPTLDVMRGLAVMGIFSVNVVGMAMIEAAYFYPPAFGFDSIADRVMWAANFILVDGKVRALFSMLFGAGIVLVCERAAATGREPWRVHYPRMVVLLGFGLAHYYLLLWGDILANYALMGMIGFMFWRLPVERLLVLALIGFALSNAPAVLYSQQMAQMHALETAGGTPEERAVIATWRTSLIPAPAVIAADAAAHRSIVAHAEWALREKPLRPFESVPGYGIETLALMLLGMAGYRAGFLTGAWPRRRMLQVAAWCIGASLLYFAASAWAILRADFDPFTFIPLDQYWAGPLRPVAGVGYAAAVILLVPRRGALADRLTAVGRMAFSNYLGASLVGTLLFSGDGLGLFGHVSRAQAWLFVPPVWALMLWWSPWWLARFRYGPLEWAWRSLARGRWEPLRRVKEKDHG
jgi:uncharacterized protein